MLVDLNKNKTHQSGNNWEIRIIIFMILIKIHSWFTCVFLIINCFIIGLAIKWWIRLVSLHIINDDINLVLLLINKLINRKWFTSLICLRVNLIAQTHFDNTFNQHVETDNVKTCIIGIKTNKLILNQHWIKYIKMIEIIRFKMHKTEQHNVKHFSAI